MRKTLFIAAAGFAFAIAGQALAAPPSSGNSNMPSTDAPSQSTAPSSTPDSSTAPPSSSSTTAPSGSAADTSATAAAAAPALTVGEPVKDNTGATIGAISSLNTGSNGQQMAVIKMGNDTFQVPGDRLGVSNGSATINLSQAQITGMIHPPAGGK